MRLFINEQGKGSVALARHRMTARGYAENWSLALDDDSYPEQSDCLACLAAIFAVRPKLAILHFPPTRTH